ncbi:TPA: alcohol dehydrogenase [Candidatus Poribacteria bacterium]|nr:alcohol dehydrogenase [Candidatus Poribacteria bacterium]
MDKVNGEIKIEIKEFPEPALEAGAVMLKTIYSEICGTDVHLSHGQLAEVPYPIIPGHINVGIIEKISRTVCDVEGNPFQVGDMVTFLDVHETCNNCWYCLVAKATTRCPNRKVYGITYSVKDGLLGGWSQKIYLKPGVKIIKLPSNLPPIDFIAGGCGAPTALHAVERATIKLDDTVIVQGSGAVGLNAAIFSMLSGASQVIVVDPSSKRLEMAKQLGVDYTIDASSGGERIAEALKLTNGRGADVTIEASGNPKAVSEGMNMTRDNGTYVIVGQYTDAGDVSINPHWQINKKHLDIRGTWGIDYSHLYKTIRLMAKHRERFGWHRFVSKIYSLDEVETALNDVENLQVMKAVIAPNGD